MKRVDNDDITCEKYSILGSRSFYLTPETAYFSPYFVQTKAAEYQFITQII